MLNCSPEFKFPIYLEHNISKYQFGEFERFSQWCVPRRREKYELLSAKYDGLNRLISLNIGPLWREFKCDGESEILTSWNPLKERETVFAYRNGMIYAIASPIMPTGKPAFLFIRTHI